MTSLNSEITSAGEQLLDDDGKGVATISYRADTVNDVMSVWPAKRQCWRYEFIADQGETPWLRVQWFASREAAEFRALSDYAEHMATVAYLEAL
jgi:hypothetical protein